MKPKQSDIVSQEDYSMENKLRQVLDENKWLRRELSKTKEELKAVYQSVQVSMSKYNAIH
jgi:flagellar capping protein FliD